MKCFEVSGKLINLNKLKLAEKASGSNGKPGIMFYMEDLRDFVAFADVAERDSAWKGLKGEMSAL